MEGNHYFPSDSINRKYFKESKTHTTCSWKGVASYYHIEVDGKINEDAAWYYPEPKEASPEYCQLRCLLEGCRGGELGVAELCQAIETGQLRPVFELH